MKAKAGEGDEGAPARRGRGRRAAGGGGKLARILVGVRLEERLVKVMKGLAELRNCTFGELMEEIVTASLEGSSTFADRSGRMAPEIKQQIASLKQVYGMNYSYEDLLKIVHGTDAGRILK